MHRGNQGRSSQTTNTPLMNSSKHAKLYDQINANDRSYDNNLNNMSNGKIDPNSTLDINNSKKSPFQSSKKHHFSKQSVQSYQMYLIDESHENISQIIANTSQFDQTSIFASPGYQKLTDKSSNLQTSIKQQYMNNKNPLLSNPTLQSQTSVNSQTQQYNQEVNNKQSQSAYISPSKSSKLSPQKGSQPRSGRSSSRDSSSHRDHSHGKRSLHNSASRRSYSTDQDQSEKSFAYPCQAFKQFLLTVREGKIDMKDLNNSPFLVDYLTMQAHSHGGGAQSTTDQKPFTSTLRQSSNPRQNSRGRDSSAKAKRNARDKKLNVPKESILEEDEDDATHTQYGTNSNYNTFNKTDGSIPNRNSSLSKGGKQNQSKDTKTRDSLSKHNFKEDQKSKKDGSQSPLKLSDLKNNSQMKNQNSSQKKQRRGRNDRSTSGDERNKIVEAILEVDESTDLRFDEKGRPIQSNKYSSQKQNPYRQSEDEYNTGGGSNNKGSLNNSFQSKQRRGRKDRSVNSDDAYNDINYKQEDKQNPLMQSPNEPRSISKLPKPAARDDDPKRSIQNKEILKLVHPNDTNPLSDGTFKDYQNSGTGEIDPLSERDKLPLLAKNTDFNSDVDYNLTSLNNQDLQKKYLKQPSPLKKQQYKEDDSNDIDRKISARTNEDVDLLNDSKNYGKQYEEEKDQQSNQPVQMITRKGNNSKSKVGSGYNPSNSNSKSKTNLGKNEVDQKFDEDDGTKETLKFKDFLESQSKPKSKGENDQNSGKSGAFRRSDDSSKSNNRYSNQLQVDDEDQGEDQQNLSGKKKQRRGRASRRDQSSDMSQGRPSNLSNQGPNQDKKNNIQDSDRINNSQENLESQLSYRDQPRYSERSIIPEELPTSKRSEKTSRADRISLKEKKNMQLNNEDDEEGLNNQPLSQQIDGLTTDRQYQQLTDQDLQSNPEIQNSARQNQDKYPLEYINSEGQQERENTSPSKYSKYNTSPNRRGERDLDQNLKLDDQQLENQKSVNSLNLVKNKKQSQGSFSSSKTFLSIKQKTQYKSRLRELEDKLKKSVQENPTKPLDYALINELQNEAAKTIQNRLKEIKQTQDDDVVRRGRFCDRKIQTDPVNLFSLAANSKNDMDKFKKFFFAVFYTYMMMNTIMADAFKKK
ncbi:UNKNOWN [Stylonychia lemnae]|uniref:Uncharacterized protein n=1 Tax=Stylonychia lemnae TaxID=5949 RepID=A0A077ZZK6_STYLE|nr:UNKNOWN [Stylonychia lemnae]|eukprot:CDW75356.1 UNKNOWN [Stylonychia lemnae]